ncbi:protein phosphatase 2C domain-containing protein [Glycomyces xiaoerkulensis]|uniref:protein phosphatase 2C domain-containing protein n=1 Tax=Glycomyces xiaoerkulensis TaxID=2038139 RepID=UPI000C2622B7|nr:protein phosphatase 2C domain-containing protein [Glycomyces xiaoerkulensis]
MTGERNLPTTVQPPPPWGDVDGPWIPDTVGRRAKAAEAVWGLDPDPHYPDSVLDHGGAGHIEVIACSVRGAQHRYEGTGRQDASMAGAAGRWALAAVADGVGSVPDSHLASETAVATVIGGLTARIELNGDEAIGDGRGVFADANRGLEKLGGPRTTLTAAAVATEPDAEGRYRFWVGKVGDSPAYVLGTGGFEELLAPDGDEEFSNAVDPMPSHELDRHYRCFQGHLRLGEVLVLASDGIGGLMESEEASDYFARQWAAGPPEPSQFMRHVQLRSRSFDDDRSAAALWAGAGRDAGRAASLRTRPPSPDGPPLARDLELRAARAGGIEFRAAARRGPDSAAAGRPRAVRVAAVEAGPHFVAAVAGPVGEEAPDRDAELWTEEMLEVVDRYPPTERPDEWIKVVWTRVLRRLADRPGFDESALACAALCASADPDGGLDWSVGLMGPIGAAVCGAGLHSELPRMYSPTTYGIRNRPGEPELHFYSERLRPDQTLMIGGGADPSGLARMRGRPAPGPLRTLGLLDSGEAARDRCAVIVWGVPDDRR